MIQRASLFLSLVLLSTSACTSSVSAESHIGERLERFRYLTKWEVRAKAERHRMREQARADGKRVCEEGDWPQHWVEDCNRCGCDIGEVRWCTDAYCRAAEWRKQQQQQGPLTAAPTSSADVESVEGVESQVGKRLEKLTRRSMAELEDKAWRHRERENLRAAGARVCEEGEWPQEWWDGCKWCWCDVGEVRQCDFGPECDETVERKLQQQAADDANENPDQTP
jgi:hypothetical protein